MATKIYIMATPCSGKSRFSRESRRYEGMVIVDFSRVNKLGARLPVVGPLIAPGRSYHERMLAYLKRKSRPICVLGRIGPPDPHRFAGITLAAVVPPESLHRENCLRRRQADAASRWGDFAAVQVLRERLLLYAGDWGIPVYDSFRIALDDLARQSSRERDRLLAAIAGAGCGAELWDYIPFLELLAREAG